MDEQQERRLSEEQLSPNLVSNVEEDEYLEQSPPLEPISTTTATIDDMDKPMTDVEPTPTYSITEDVDTIIKKEITNFDEEIIETKVDHWIVPSWQQLDTRTIGPVIKAGGHDWNILMFPKGNNQTDFASIYLDLTNAKANNPDEYACAQFAICLSKPSDPSKYYLQTAYHRFTSDESDWGFTRFVPIDGSAEKSLEAFLEDDSVRITTIIRVMRDVTGILWHNFVNYDSKKVTGCVGLQNQGATCYMNSLFQSLYFTNSFRKAVYQIPTETDEPTKSIALALQRVFYNLQFSNTAVGTTELTKSFGWDSLEAFRQHDVQEFNRVLQDNLEIKMKNTPADGAIKNLFVGRMKSYIKCINVNFESSRLEDYYDIQLNVKGCKNLEDSFKDYITEETLEGDNKYMAEGYGLQDAKKGVIFESFPPVLHLQLKRFEYDMMRDMMVKINDRHEFPTEIDLEPYLSENADKSQGHRYKLHGVLVHSGDLSGGHYFAFVKPEKDGKWYKFDDDRVIPCTLKEVLEENYGGEHMPIPGVNLRPNGRPINRFTNAYMLVYIRECMLDEVLAPVTEKDIPRHLAERIETEARIREQKRREKEEQHLYMKTLIATDDTFIANTGFDFVNFDEKEAVNNHLIVQRVRKDVSFGSFKEELAKALGTTVDYFRLWLMVNRQNRTVRVDMPIPVEEDNSTLEDIRQKYSTNQNVLRFYLEKCESVDPQGGPIYPTTSDAILLFIKHFKPEHQLIHGVGHLYVPKDEKVHSIVSTLKQMVQFSEDQEILLFEEIKAGMIDPVDFNSTFAQAELQDGDILCVQKKLTPEEENAIQSRGGLTTTNAFLDYELGKIPVYFSPFTPDQDLPDFVLWLHKDMGYEEVASRVAAELNTDSKKLRLINPQLQGTGRAPLKRFAGMKLGKILPNAFVPGAVGQKSRFLYEKLDVSLEEIESKCSVTVTVCTPTLKQMQVVEVLLPKDSGMAELKEALLAKGVRFETTSGTRELRIFDEMDGKFDKEYNDKLWREAVSTRAVVKVYAEEIPEEEVNMDENDNFINVFHFQRTPTRTHSVPFKFVLKEHEPLSETKRRLQARTGLDDKEWSKVKINIVADDEETITPINDDDETLFSSYSYKSGDMIGLDHVDKSSKVDKTGAIFIRG